MENNFYQQQNINHSIKTAENNDKFSLQTIKVEELLNEFYSDRSSNERKRQIERDLGALKDTNVYLDFLIYDLDNINNKCLWFFKISCLENAIIRGNFDHVRQKLVENILWNVYKNIPLSSPKLQREKLAQLLVQLLIQNFQVNDEIVFLEETVKLINDKFLFGIILLRTLSDEIFSTRSNVCAQKKEFMRLCFLGKLQPICNIVQNYVIYLCDYINQNKHQLEDNELFKDTTIEVLTCVQHLITWVQLDHLITEDFLNRIFKLATLKFTNQPEISFAALTTICELFYRQTALPLPHQTANRILDLLDGSNLMINDTTYLDKLTELLILFTSKSFLKLMNDEYFRFFLNRLYNFTTNSKFLNDGLEFSNKMLIWKSIIKVHMPIKNNLGKYENVLIELVMFILKNQILFTKGSQTQFLDNNNLDDDMKTSWQHFVGPCIEYILLVIQREPYNLVKILLDFWNHFVENLIKLKNSDDLDNTTTPQLNSINGAKILRNLSTLSQILAALPSTLDEPYPIELYDNLIQKFDNLIQLLFHIRHIYRDSEYENEIENLTVQFMIAVKCYLPLWERNFSTQNFSIHNFLKIALHFVIEKWYEPKLIQFEAAQLLLTISSTIRLKCMLEDDLIKTFLNTAYDLDSLSVKLLNQSTKCRHEIVPIIVFESLCNILLLPWEGVPEKEQMFDQRIFLFQNFIHKIANDFLIADIRLGNEEIVCNSVIKCLPIVTEIVEYYRGSNNSLKLKLLKSYEPLIIRAVSILNTYNNLNPIAFECIIDFSKGIIGTLQNQFSVTTIKELLEIILTATSKIDDAKNQFKSLDKILQMFILIIEKPGNISKSLYPYGIRFAIDHVFPMIQDEQKAKYMDNVVVSLYSLLDCILQNKWNHFYTNQVLNKPTVDLLARENPIIITNNEELKSQEDFLNIFMAYGFGILIWKDPEVKQIILNSMNSLNERKKLYSREYFRKNLFHHFLGAFLKTIMQAEGSLHYDTLVSIIFSMGQIDNLMLRQVFHEYGYAENTEILLNIFESTDLPTFSDNMYKLIYDTKLYTNNLTAN